MPLMSTPGALLGQFLVAVNGFILHDNESQLADYLVLEPPFNAHYQQMIAELREVYPKGSEDSLEAVCEKALTCTKEDSDGMGGWSALVKFMTQYLGYLRDVDISPDRYLQTYESLSELQTRANSALVHATLGHLLIPTVVSCARLICRLAIGLDKQPSLIAHLKSSQSGGEDGGPRETLPERAANLIRQAFVTCLNDRSSGLDANGRPEGKKRGVYLIANICLKILFQCHKTRNATQIFENIHALSPRLDAYPKRDQVTYLYYLGRFLFESNHFYRSQLALQHAYDICSARADYVKQRRLILVHLVTCNIILGRIPSQRLFQTPEAKGFQERFLPIMQSIRKGDLLSLHQHLDLNAPHAAWFLHFRILLQLQNRCEVLAWRSLVRKTWLLVGTRYDPQSRNAPLVNMDDLLVVFTFLYKRLLQAYPHDGSYVDPDLEGVELPKTSAEALLPSSRSIDSIVGSLIDQGFLRGYIAYKQNKFAIQGAKQRGGDALAAGFPVVWEVVKEKGDDEVPGWKKDDGRGSGGYGPGQVVRLSGARAVGER